MMVHLSVLEKNGEVLLHILSDHMVEFFKILLFLSLKIVFFFIFTNRADPEEMPHSAVLGIICYKHAFVVIC